MMPELSGPFVGLVAMLAGLSPANASKEEAVDYFDLELLLAFNAGGSSRLRRARHRRLRPLVMHADDDQDFGRGDPREADPRKSRALP